MSMAKQMANFRDLLKSALILSGFEIGHHVNFSKWAPSGDRIGNTEIQSMSQFKELLTDGTFFLDMDNVKITTVGPIPFFVNYLNIDLTLKNGNWEGSVYTETEEVPHDFAEPKKLDERRKQIEGKLLSVVRFLSVAATCG